MSKKKKKVNLYDNNYKLYYRSGKKSLSASKINKIDDTKIYEHNFITKNPVIFLGSAFSAAHFEAFKLALKKNKEIVFLAGAPINPPPFPPKID